MGLTESNEAQIMGEEKKSHFNETENLVENAYCSGQLSKPLRNSVRNMKSNSKIQRSCRGRSLSITSVDQATECDGLNASSTNKDSLEDLEKKVAEEKDITRKLMEEFSTFLKSIESSSVV